MLKVRDKWFRFIVLLLPAMVSIYSAGILEKPTTEKITQAFVSLCVIVLVCECSRYLIYKSHQWFPRRFRLLLVLIIGVLLTALMLAASAVIRNYISTGIWDFTQMKDAFITISTKTLVIGLIGHALVNGLVYFTILLVGYEILYRQAQLQYAERERQKLSQEKMRAELLQLKGIVNPHFLFNNLNSLSALIAEDPVKAQVFLDELTRVFRYLLRNNQIDLTPLSEEVKFIQTYYHLLQTRYGEAIRMDIHVDEAYNDLLLPPLTLQLLVENAVKHNRIQKENPLHIELLSVPDNKLVLRNTILKKEGVVESTGIGLQNINARYEILNHDGVVIEKNEKNFGVIIPLLDGKNINSN